MTFLVEMRNTGNAKYNAYSWQQFLQMFCDADAVPGSSLIYELGGAVQISSHCYQEIRGVLAGGSVLNQVCSQIIILVRQLEAHRRMPPFSGFSRPKPLY
jgi:hypothetical protein